MDLLISHRQGIQQLRDEMDAIRMEVVELPSRPASPAPSTSSPTLYDVASSPTPHRLILDLNSPPDSLEEAQDGTPLDKA